MKYDFSEKNFGAAAEILETLTAHSIAMQLAISALIQYSPNALGHVMALEQNVEEMLLPMEISDQTISLVRSCLRDLTTP